MQQVPIDIKVTPASLDEVDTWRSELLWRPQTKDQIVDYIRTKIRSNPEVKSGLVLFRDFDINQFQQITFSQKSIFQPESADAIVKFKKAAKGKKPYTFEEKTEALKIFITQHGRFPNDSDKFPEGPNLYTFYKSLKKSQDKYASIIDDCKSDPKYDPSTETTASGGDNGLLGRGRRVSGGRGSDDVEIEEEEIDLDTPVKKSGKK